jgi:hypothetical protein
MQIQGAFNRDEIRRALSNFHYERTKDGIYFRGPNQLFKGVFRHRLVEACGAALPWNVEPNTWTFNGLDDILQTYFAQLAQHTQFFIAPFSGNVTPQQTWTAANFAENSTEFENYSESTRVLWDPDAEADQTIQNAAVPARFTIDVVGPSAVYGAGMIADASVKGDNTGLLVAAAKFSTAQTGLTNGSKLDIEYTITAADAG